MLILKLGYRTYIIDYILPLLSQSVIEEKLMSAVRNLKTEDGRVSVRDKCFCEVFYRKYKDEGGINFEYSGSLTKGMFDRLTNLKVLLLTNSKLVELPEGIFDRLTNLQYLYLGHNNKLTVLPEKIFDKLTNIRTLYLNHNNLTMLPENIFDRLINLQILYLHNNNLTVLPENIFDRLTNLKILWLQHNNLTRLPENIFDRLTNLQYLYCKFTSFEDVQSVTARLRNNNPGIQIVFR